MWSSSGAASPAAPSPAGSPAAATVLVLEREERFTDRIRGEGFGQYGFDQVTALGLADVVLAVPAMNVATRVVPYDEALDIATAEQAAVARNVYCCGHPDLRERLAVDAAGKGAVVQRGVDEVSIRPGARPTVAFRTPDGAGREVGARLVIGADGKDLPSAASSASSCPAPALPHRAHRPAGGRRRGLGSRRRHRRRAEPLEVLHPAPR
ncbi:MAG: FAD-dependent monooxygenase [Acidimicrobiales bacterium]